MRTSIFRVRIFRPRKFKWSVCVQICSVQISEICSVFNKLLKTLRVVGLRDLTYQANLQLSFSRCLAIRKILSPGSSTRINPPPNLARLSLARSSFSGSWWHCFGIAWRKFFSSEAHLDATIDPFSVSSTVFIFSDLQAHHRPNLLQSPAELPAVMSNRPPTREPARKKIPRGEQKKNKRRAKTMKNDSPQLLQTRTANLNRAGTGANRRREIQICTRSKNPGAYFNAVRFCKYLSKFDADRWVASFARAPY